MARLNPRGDTRGAMGGIDEVRERGPAVHGGYRADREPFCERAEVAFDRIRGSGGPAISWTRDRKGSSHIVERGRIKGLG